MSIFIIIYTCKNLIQSSKLVIITYPSTTLLEGIEKKTPIIEWFPKHEYFWIEKEFNKQNASKNKGAGKGKEILITNYQPALTLE